MKCNLVFIDYENASFSCELPKYINDKYSPSDSVFRSWIKLDGLIRKKIVNIGSPVRSKYGLTEQNSVSAVDAIANVQIIYPPLCVCDKIIIEWARVSNNRKRYHIRIVASMN